MLRPASDLPHAARLAAANWWVENKVRVHLLITLDETGDAYPPSGSDVWYPELWRAPHWRWLDKVTADGV